MFTYTLTILYRYAHPNLNILYGILLNTELPKADWVDKLIVLSPFVGGFVIGVVCAVLFYERQQKSEKTATETVNKKIKELSDQHVEEFKTLSEQQLQRYDKEMAAKDEQIKVKDTTNENLVEYWRKAVQDGIDNQAKTATELRVYYESIISKKDAINEAVVSKKDAIIADDKEYIREKDAEMKQALLDSQHILENISAYLTRENPESLKEIFTKISELNTHIKALCKSLENPR